MCVPILCSLVSFLAYNDGAIFSDNAIEEVIIFAVTPLQIMGGYFPAAALTPRCHPLEALWNQDWHALKNTPNLS